MSSEGPQQKYAIRISYVGTRYCGWQRQPAEDSGAPNIQETIEQAVKQITGESPNVVGSGRTDAGVHALGQVAHFRLEKKAWEPWKLERGLNSALPKDIRVLEAKPVAMEFHAQRSAVKKQYSYYFAQGSCPLPHLEPFSWWIAKRLDLGAIREAAGQLVGEHDFKPFQARGAKPGSTTVRKILEAEITELPVAFPVTGGDGFGLVRVRLIGTGFLKQMVRGIAGTLVQVGESKRPASSVREILESGDRSLVGQTAAARGLWLEQVWYQI